MKINLNTYSNTNFTRALTKKEEESYSKLLDDSFDTLDIKDSTAIVFDFNIPSKKGLNTGIGTSFSKNAQDFFNFIKKYAGIKSIQYGPQGKVSSANTSPYSGTNFALGEHIIDLEKLTTEEYASILPIEYIEKLDKNYPADKNSREYKTNYDYVLGDNSNKGIQRKALYKAFENFQKKLKTQNPNAIQLDNEFKTFKEENSHWLEKDVLFEVLAKKYKTADFSKWNEEDKNLYTLGNLNREQKIDKIKKEHGKEIEFQQFIQFIATKQQKETKDELNEKNIKLYGDCLIGFSESEIWANQDCFRENLFYGGPDPNCPETNGIQTWGLRALDYTKLGKCDTVGDLSELGEVGKFLYTKYANFFKRYDGLRMDAAWQFVTPFIYQTVNNTFEEVKMPEIGNTIFNILKTAANDFCHSTENINDNIMLELVGISAQKSRDLTINQYPHLYTTAYAQYDESPQKFLEKGYEQGKFIVGTTNHDNETIIEMAKNQYIRDLHSNGIKRDFGFDFNALKYQDKDYQSQNEEQKTQEDFRNAKMAEVYTAQKQFFTLTDMFGMGERINISGKSDANNWTVRVPNNYEEFYFSQLQQGYGMNMPKILANAMRMKGVNDKKIIEKSEELAEILRQKGATTQEEAETDFKNGKITNPFVY